VLVLYVLEKFSEADAGFYVRRRIWGCL